MPAVKIKASQLEIAFASNLVASKRVGGKSWKRCEKRSKKNHAPFSIMHHFPSWKVHGIRAISLWRNTWKNALRSLKYHRIWSLRSSFQSRFNLTLPCVNQATKSAWQRYQWERVTNSCAIHFFVFKMTSCFEFGSLCVCVSPFLFFAECLVLQCSIWVFPKIGVGPQNGWWKQWKTLLNWMIWGKTHYFWKHPDVPTLKSTSFKPATISRLRRWGCSRHMMSIAMLQVYCAHRP